MNQSRGGDHYPRATLFHTLDVTHLATDNLPQAPNVSDTVGKGFSTILQYRQGKVVVSTAWCIALGYFCSRFAAAIEHRQYAIVNKAAVTSECLRLNSQLWARRKIDKHKQANSKDPQANEQFTQHPQKQRH